MKLQNLDMRGMGRTIQVSLFIGDEPDASASRQWLDAAVEVPVQGVMDEVGLQIAAMNILRDALSAQIAALRSDQFG